MSASATTARAPARRRGSAELVMGQVHAALRDLWRSRVAFVFTFLFPLTWLLLLGFLAGNDAVYGDSGVRLMQFVTPTAAVMGVLYGAYPTVAASLAQSREQGVLKRVRGTPLPAWVYLAGRLGAAAVLAIGSVAVMLAVGVLAYDVRLQSRTAVATAGTLTVAIVCFAALGLAVASVARSAASAQAASISSMVVLAMLSGVLIVGDLPAWADRLAGVFPIKPFNDALRGQLDPFGSGSGWDLGALGIMTAWGLAGAAVAVRTFRWDPVRRAGRTSEPGTQAAAPAPTARRTAPPQASLTGRPSGVRLALDQAGAALRSSWRSPGGVFFAMAMPVGLYALMMQMDTDGITMPGGVPFTLYAAAGMATWGAAVAGFVNMPEVVARARDNGVLKRLRGTPLRPALYLAGQAAAALGTALLTVTLLLGLGVLALNLRVPPIAVMPAAALLVLATATFAACGLALAAALPPSKAVTAAGLAVLLPVSFLSDVFPSSEPPAWMGTVGSFLPMKHLANGLVAVLDSSGWSVDRASVAVLTAWLTAASLVAWRAFSWGGDSQTGARSSMSAGTTHRADP